MHLVSGTGWSPLTSHCRCSLACFHRPSGQCHGEEHPSALWGEAGSSGVAWGPPTPLTYSTQPTLFQEAPLPPAQHPGPLTFSTAA